MSVAKQAWTMGEAARELCCSEHWLRRQYKLKRLPEPQRAGTYRVLLAEDLERARALMTAQKKTPAQR